MARRAEIVNEQGREYFQWYCPVCKAFHRVIIGLYTADDFEADPEREGFKRLKADVPNYWRFDGNLEMPTVAPMVSVQLPGGGECKAKIENGKLYFCSGSQHGNLGVMTMPLVEG